LTDKTTDFLRQTYREYYFRNADSIEFPEEIQAREFGYMPFGGGMVRHVSFKNRGEALAEILRQSPSSVYCSNALYEFPTMSMEEKGWRGAELIFDIDATDIPTQCKRSHDGWFCTKCYYSGRLPKPPKCHRCGGQTTEFHGTCEVCLGAAKDHALRVMDFLVLDFGVEPGAVRLYFSGNRGYHLHVFDRRFLPLDQLARGELAGYMRGESLPPTQTLASTLRRRQQGWPQGEGWTRRITGYVDERWPGYDGTLRKLVSEAITAQRALVDSSVTVDVHRVFRLAGTLHGNTGMPKMRVESPRDFDPQEDAVVLPSTPVLLNVDYYPRFKVKGREFGPFKSETVELPVFAAISILTRGQGEVV
jgi:DNA primase small subunit